MFTLEIAGRPIAVIGADEEEARDIVESEAFQADLRRLLHDATPLWDGRPPSRCAPPRRRRPPTSSPTRARTRRRRTKRMRTTRTPSR
ncbi:hypothetical protein [Teichococcus aestuarii]|uniref:hypothetical protein n=1 Tax=Teichococcus aestuarii TaxID=568898 RepID=UPI0036207C9B